MHRVVMVARVFGVDGDQRQVAPVLAALHGRLAGALSLGQRGGRKHVGNFVGVDGDEADGFFGRHRTEPLRDLCLRQAKAAFAQNFQRDQIAVLRLAAHVLRHGEFAVGVLLVDRHDAPAAARRIAENAKHLRPRFGDEFDHAPGVERRRALSVVVDFDAQQRAAADAGHGRAGFLAARRFDQNARRLAGGFIPINGFGD